MCRPLVLLLAFLSCAQSPPNQARVRRVIDGDTIQLESGQLVRYAGIDTPEVRRREGNDWVEDPEPYARAATEENRGLVEGLVVRLEYDVQSMDRFGRLLAYVYRGDMMINAELLRRGLAQPMTIPPNVRHAELFRLLAHEARDHQRGLWSEDRPAKREVPEPRGTPESAR